MGTYTTHYNLFMPSVGEQGWGTLVNGNFTTIDTTMKSLSNHIGSLETEMDATEERVTTLEAGEFESITAGTITSTGKIYANGGIEINNLTTLTSESGIIGGVYCSTDVTLVSSGSMGSKTSTVTYKSNPLNNTVRFDFYTASVSHKVTNSGSIAINGSVVKTFSATGDTNGQLSYHSNYSITLNNNDVIVLTTNSSSGDSRGAAIKLHIAGYLISN